MVPKASVTVAVATLVLVPSAGIEEGASASATLVAGPAVWISFWLAETPPLTEVSVAVMLAAPAVVVEVIVAR